MEGSTYGDENAAARAVFDPEERSKLLTRGFP